MSNSVVLIALVLVTSVAVVTDLRHNRIPNAISLAGILGGCGINAMSMGILDGLITSVAGALVAGGMLLPFYMMRGMAAGDVKLMAAVGAIVGWPHAIAAVALTLVSGSILALFYVFIRGGGIELFQRLSTAVRYFVRFRVFQLPAAEEGSVARSRFPYALAIAAGGILATL